MNKIFNIETFKESAHVKVSDEPRFCLIVEYLKNSGIDRSSDCAQRFMREARLLVDSAFNYSSILDAERYWRIPGE